MEEGVLRFIELFPFEIESMASFRDEKNNLIRIFWTKNENSDDGDDLVKTEIKSAFRRIQAPGFKGLIQFWAPSKNGTMLLSSCHQPFALSVEDLLDTHSGVESYKLCSIKSRYSISLIDENDNNNVEKDLIINVLDLSLHKGRNPLVDKALDSGFTCLILLPVFYDDDPRSCVGVVECCMTLSGLLKLFYLLKDALERVGLTTYSIKECIQQQIQHGVKHENKDGLKMICESLHLSLAQVWIPPPAATNNHDDDTSIVKCCGYHVAASYDHNNDIMAYYDTCDVLPLKIGEGLPGKTFEAKQLRCTINLANLRLNGCSGILPSLSANTKSSCLVICLKSVHTGELVFAFEFLWPKTRNYLILMESVLSKLNTCLPSFKLASSGEQLCDDLRLTPVETSGFYTSFTIQKRGPGGNRLSKTPKEEEWQRPKIVKRRKFIDFGAASQTYYDYWAYDTANDFIFVIADYKGTTTLFTLKKSSSYTFANLKHKVEQEFNLNSGTYIMEFQPEWDKNLNFQPKIQDDLSYFIKLWLIGRKTSRPFNVCVLPSTN